MSLPFVISALALLIYGVACLLGANLNRSSVALALFEIVVVSLFWFLGFTTGVTS